MILELTFVGLWIAVTWKKFRQLCAELLRIASLMTLEWMIVGQRSFVQLIAEQLFAEHLIAV